MRDHGESESTCARKWMDGTVRRDDSELLGRLMSRPWSYWTNETSSGRADKESKRQ